MLNYLDATINYWCTECDVFSPEEQKCVSEIIEPSYNNIV